MGGKENQGGPPDPALCWVPPGCGSAGTPVCTLLPRPRVHSSCSYTSCSARVSGSTHFQGLGRGTSCTPSLQASVSAAHIWGAVSVITLSARSERPLQEEFEVPGAWLLEAGVAPVRGLEEEIPMIVPMPADSTLSGLRTERVSRFRTVWEQTRRLCGVQRRCGSGSIPRAMWRDRLGARTRLFFHNEKVRAPFLRPPF